MIFGRRRILRRILGGSRIAALGALHSTRRHTRAGAPAIMATGLIVLFVTLAIVTLLIATITK